MYIHTHAHTTHTHTHTHSEMNIIYNHTMARRRANRRCITSPPHTLSHTLSHTHHYIATTHTLYTHYTHTHTHAHMCYTMIQYNPPTSG